MSTAAFDPRIGDIAGREHRHLLDVAFRMLGDVGRAEDMVQEAFVRLARTDLDRIDDVRGWLVVVVGRLCLDHLRAASTRREAAAETWTLEAATVGEADPADRVTLDDAVFGADGTRAPNPETACNRPFATPNAKRSESTSPHR